jgi:hypothetical protein
MEKPILFSTEMVKAILEGRKTQTRRVIKSRTNGGFIIGKADRELPDIEWFYHDREVIAIDEDENHLNNIFCPYGKVGDILWVRETIWEHGHYYTGSFDETGEYETRWIGGSGVSYAATDTKPEKCRTKPSIHMHKKYARIFLEITDIRVERLWTITWDDAVAEGCPGYRPTQDEPTQQFERLWKRINGLESWNENPWVWVISFKVLSTTGRPKVSPTPHNIESIEPK